MERLIEDTPVLDTTSPDLATLWPSFARDLRARNKSPKTEDVYHYAVRSYLTFAERVGTPTAVASLRREHLEMWIDDLLRTRRPSTAALYHAGMQQLLKWAVEEGEIAESPGARIKGPTVPEPETPILSPEEIGGLLETCDLGSFKGRRDAALIRVMYSSGLRVSEVLGVRWLGDGHPSNDLDLDRQAIQVMGKGSRPRVVGIGVKAVRALDRYLRSRATHHYGDLPWLWITDRAPGRLTPSGVNATLKLRGKVIGRPDIHAHVLRHSWASQAQMNGGSLLDVKTMGGWKSLEVMARYGSTAATARALSSHHSWDPGDRV